MRYVKLRQICLIREIPAAGQTEGRERNSRFIRVFIPAFTFEELWQLAF
jgi:hypothetical protein